MEQTHIAPSGSVPEGVGLWLEPGEPILLRAVDGGDPLELTAQDARDLAAALIELANLAERT